jgi:hypothetical protein
LAEIVERSPHVARLVRFLLGLAGLPLFAGCAHFSRPCQCVCQCVQGDERVQRLEGEIRRLQDRIEFEKRVEADKASPPKLPPPHEPEAGP